MTQTLKLEVNEAKSALRDRGNGSLSGSALTPVPRSSALLRRRPWIGLSDESGRSRDGQKASA